MPEAPLHDIDGEPYHELYTRSVTEALAGAGVRSGLGVTATANALEVEVTAGEALVATTATTLGTAATATLSAGDTDDRWDLVALDTGTGSVVVREGTPAQNPTPPDIQSGEVVLATVYVAAGATDVGDDDIVDLRSRPRSAAGLRYDDATGTFGVTDVGAALDELQEAAQLGAYPLSLATDTDLDLGSADLSAADGATTVFDAAAGAVPRPQIDTDRQARTVTSSTTTAGDGSDEVIHTDSSGGALTVTLASADAVAGRQVVVADAAGAAGTNAVTVDTEGSESIEGASSISLSADYATAVLESDGTDWSVVARTPASGSSGSDTRTDVSDGGTTVVSDTSDIDFATNLSVTDDGDGSVTVDAADTNTDTTVDVADDGTTVVSEATLLDFAGGQFTVANPSGSEAAVGVDEAGLSLANLGSRSHSDLADAPAAAHHAKTTTLDELTDADAVALLIDTAANRPAAGTAGRLFIETDTGRTLYDDGSSWVEVGLSESEVSLANLGSRSHSDLADAPAAAHHAEPSAGAGVTDEGTNQFGLDVIESSSVALSSGSATINTGVTTTGATFHVALGTDDPGSDTKVAARMVRDSSTGEHKVEIVEDGTSQNPVVYYDIIRVS